MTRIATFDSNLMNLNIAAVSANANVTGDSKDFLNNLTEAKSNVTNVEKNIKKTDASLTEEKTKTEDFSKESVTTEDEEITTITDEVTEEIPEEEPAEITENQTQDFKEEPTEIDEEVLDEIKETLAEIMMTLEQNIGVDKEELIDTLKDLNINLEDFITEDVNQVVLETLGTDDISLITDEDLFSQVSDTVSTIEDLLQNLEDNTGLDLDELKELLTTFEVPDDTKSDETWQTPLDVEEPDIELKPMENLNTDKIELFNDKPIEENVVEQNPEELNPQVMTQVSEEKPMEKSKATDYTKNETKEENELTSMEDETTEEETIELDTSKISEKPEQKENKNESGNNEEGLSQNLNNQKFQTEINVETSKTSEVTSFTTDDLADTKALMEKLADNVKVMQDEEQTTMEMQLHPQSLGTVKIALTTRGGSVTAQFTASNESVKQALEAGVTQLKTNLEEQGVKVEAVEISVNSHSLEKNLDEKGENRNEQQSKDEDAKITKVRRRSINLNSWANGEEADEEELDEDTLLTKEMMELYGNSMDLLA